MYQRMPLSSATIHSHQTRLLSKWISLQKRIEPSERGRHAVVQKFRVSRGKVEKNTYITVAADSPASRVLTHEERPRLALFGLLATTRLPPHSFHAWSEVYLIFTLAEAFSCINTVVIFSVIMRTTVRCSAVG